MSEFPNDDKDLIHFLRQHRTKIPPALPDLEKRILQDVQTSPMQVLRPSSRLWLLPVVMAASFVAAVVGYRTFLGPAQLSAAEVASLETFIENNWHCIINVSPERNGFFQSDSIID